LPTTWPPEAFNAPLTVLAAIGAIVVTIGAAMIFVGGAVAAKVIDPHNPGSAGPEVLLTLQLSIYLPLAAYLAVILPPLSHVSLRQLGFHVPSARDVAIALVGVALMYLVVGVVETAAENFTHRHDTETAVALMQQLHTPIEQITFAVIAIVLAPLVEELTFRVFLFNAFSRYTPIWAAVVLSSLLFGAVHIIGAPPAQLLTIALPLACGGMVLAYVYASTRCYWANVITHAGFNAIGVVAVMVFHQS
jgi:membrane protease YdiL (CAAX protease family)